MEITEIVMGMWSEMEEIIAQNKTKMLLQKQSKKSSHTMKEKRGRIEFL